MVLGDDPFDDDKEPQVVVENKEPQGGVEDIEHEKPTAQEEADGDKVDI